MKKILCKIFGHKYKKIGKGENFTWCYSSTHCLRCKYTWLGEQRIYFSDGNIDDWDSGGYIET